MEPTKLIISVVSNPHVEVGYMELEKWLRSADRTNEADAFMYLVEKKFQSIALSKNTLE